MENSGKSVFKTFHFSCSDSAHIGYLVTREGPEMDFSWQTGVVPAASSGPGLSASYTGCDSALEELGLRRLLPVVLNLDFSFHLLILLL